MIIKHDNSVENIDWQDTTIKVYDLKKLIVEKKNIPIDEIHILKNTEGNECYDNNACLTNDCTVNLKIVKNRCPICLKKSATIVGDCKYCLCKYCPSHRLPEVHKCPGMSVCKKESFDKNHNTVMSQKCVAAKI